MLASVQPDIGLVVTLIGLRRVIPEHSRETARAVVRAVTDELEERLRAATVQAVTGALNRATRTRRPGLPDVDWRRTIAANLQHYLPEHRTVVPGAAGRIRAAHDAGRARTSCCASTSRARWPSRSCTPRCSVPCWRRCGRCGPAWSCSTPPWSISPTSSTTRSTCCSASSSAAAPTSTGRSPTARGSSSRPRDTIFVLISDLYEGGIAEEMLRRAPAGRGLGGHDDRPAGAVATPVRRPTTRDMPPRSPRSACPSFACTPDQFPDLMAAAIDRQDITAWAASRDIVTTHPVPG